MKTLTTIRSLMACLALAATVPAVADAQVRPNFYGQPNLVRTNAGSSDTLDPVLDRIQKIAEAGLEWQSEAERAGLTVKDDLVLVELSDISDVALLDEYRLLNSGDPTRTRAWVAPKTLGLVEAHAYRSPVANSYGAIGNEAEAAMRTDMYAAVGLTGAGVHVAVIDLGFGGLSSTDEAGRVHRVQYDMENDADNHGTAMIEALRDIAPDATITAIRLDAGMDIVGATQLAISVDANIIVCPLSWFGLPNMGQACEAVVLASDSGILWVNAAGNFANRRYFEGEGLPVTSIGGQNFVDFGDPYQFVNGMNGGDRFSVHMACKGGLQLELYRWDGLSADFVLIDQGNPDSIEQTVAHEYVDGMYYFPMVRQVAPGGIPAFRMFAVGCDLHFSVTEGSVANPAGKQVISVGAVDANNYGERSAPEPYSGIGGGIFDVKLDLCGPTGCTTGTFGPQGFHGTSAACANIAGLLALHMADPVMAADPMGAVQRIDIGGADIAMARVDAFEPDNDPSLALDLGNASVTSEAHSISPSADQDWFAFQLDTTAAVSVRAKGCEVSILVGGTMIDGSDLEPAIALAAGDYLIRVRADTFVEYTLELEIADPAPARVETMSPGSGDVVPAGKVALAWAPVQGIGSILYLIEIAADENFDAVLFEAMTAELTETAELDGGHTYYWRVTAFNEYGQAPASDTQVLVVARNQLGSDGDVVFQTLSASQPGQSSQENGTGCVGAAGASGLTAMLAAIILMTAIVRTRRKIA